MAEVSDRDGRLSAVRRLVDKGDVKGLDHELYGLDLGPQGGWNHAGSELVALLRGLPVELRVSLLRRMTESLEESAVHAPGRCRSWATLITLVAHGLTAGELADWREPLIAEAAGELTLWEGWRLTCLVEVEQAAGRRLPEPVIATVRRTAVEALDPAELPSLAAGITDPLLNPGEPWSDRALVDLAGAGPQWRALIAHALTSKASRPTAKWERAGTAALSAVGPEHARSSIASWLALAREARTSPVPSTRGGALVPDLFNVRAMQGLAWLLALAPADPESAAVLGGVVEAALLRVPGVGRRSPKLASAAVHALARLGDDDGYAELRRLETTVDYRPTVKVLAAATAALRSTGATSG